MKFILSFILFWLFSITTAFCASVLMDSHTAANGASTWTITTSHPNELIIISCGGYGTGGNVLSLAAGTVKVNGNNATYETEGRWLDPSFSWQADIWAYAATTVGTYTCTCTETGLNSPYYFNFATSVWESGCALTLSNIIIGGHDSNHGPTTITASITTTQANTWIYGTIDNNDNGGTGTVAWNGQLTALNKTYISDGIDGAQADSVYATPGTYAITSTDNGASNVWMTIALIGVQPNCIVLPIQLLNFSCSPEVRSIDLNYTTITEINSDYFTIERSGDGVNFYQLAKIKAAGFSNAIKYYNYIDEDPLYGVNYYRLSETDLDGAKNNFDIISCDINNDSIIVYPNPFSTNINLIIKEPGVVTVTLFSITGQNLGIWQMENGTHIINESILTRGVYFLQIKTQNALINKKLIKF